MAADKSDRGHRGCCVEDKAAAGRLGGHSWNIITNAEDEIYLGHARSKDHYVNLQGETTSVWFDRRRRIPHPVGGLEGANFSKNVKESLLCPGTPLSHSQRSALETRLLQASAPRDFPKFAAMAGAKEPRPGHLERVMPEQKRLADSNCRLDATKVVQRKDWTPRRGELRAELAAPEEGAMFASLGQLKAESHINVQQSSFARQLQSGSLQATLSAASSRGPEEGPRTAREKYSQRRMENFTQREISNWALGKGDDKLLRRDGFSMPPMQQPNNSGVKYDIITGRRGDFWY